MPEQRKRMVRFLHWMLVAAWAAAIFAVSATPGSRLPGGYSFQAHFIEYAILAYLLFAALDLDRPTRDAAVVAVVLASAYGVTDEVHQAFVPLRQPDVADWLVDTAGAVFGVLTALAVARIRRRFRQ